jgi:hypothetical protein
MLGCYPDVPRALELDKRVKEKLVERDKLREKAQRAFFFEENTNAVAQIIEQFKKEFPEHAQEADTLRSLARLKQEQEADTLRSLARLKQDPPNQIFPWMRENVNAIGGTVVASSTNGSEEYQKLLKSARSYENLGKKLDALASYQELVKRHGKKQFGNLDPVAFCRDVLEPAIALGKQVLQEKKEDRSLQAQVAEFYGAKGKLLVENRYKKWEAYPKGPIPTALDALEAARRLHSNKDKEMAEYHAWHGFASFLLPVPDWNSVKQDWDEALKIDPNHRWGLALKGHYSLAQAQATQLNNAAQASALAVQAIDAYALALKQLQGDAEKSFQSICHLGTSSAYVVLAHIHKRLNQSQNIQGDLEKAKAAAEQATAANPQSGDAWSALGNALEDYAWKDFGKQTVFYPQAIEAFEKAKGLYPTRLELDVALGRCYFKWACDEPKEERKLKDARLKLQEVLEADPAQAEAHFWMGKLSWREEKKPEALRAFAAALTHPTQGWVWLGPVEDTIGKDLKAWQPLFDIALPKDRPLAAKHMPLLHERSSLIYADGKLLKADLEKEDPQVLGDVDTIARLSSDQSRKAEAYLMAAGARYTAAKVYRKDLAKRYLTQTMTDLCEVLALYPDYSFAGTWPPLIAETALTCSRYKEIKPEQKKDYLDKALRVLNRYIGGQEFKGLSPQQQELLRKYQQQLEEKRRELEQ